MSGIFNVQPRFDVPGPLAISIIAAAWAGRKIGRLTRIAAHSPAHWVLLSLLVSLTAVHVTPLLLYGLAAASIAGLVFWRARFPDGFALHVSGRFRGSARSLFVYRWRWSFALKTCGVIARWRDAPLLLRTFSTPMYDQLRVRMVSGQRVADFADRTDRLTQTFNALDCRVRAVPGRPHWLDLTFLTDDPLIEPLEPYPPEPDWQAGLPVAICEDGNPWLLKLLGSHLLLVGATGSGKSSVLWSIIHQLIPAVTARTCRLWVLDPKGGMEMFAGQQYFDRFAYGSTVLEFVGILEDAVRVMQRRQAALRGVTRQHTPSPEEPLIAVVIDELALLTAWTTDTEAHNRIQAAIATLLRQGRAVGVIVVGAIQDPSKEVLPFRDLFPIRIALRLVEATQVDMALGRGAWAAGARCDEIPEVLQGVGYVVADGTVGHQRVRFAHVTDDMIQNLNSDDEPIAA